MAYNILKGIDGMLFGAFGTFTVPPNHVSVILRLGQIDRVVPSGLRWAPPLMRHRINLFSGQQSLQLDPAHIVDARGNPIHVSAMVNWTLQDAERFLLQLNAETTVMQNTADAIIKQIASQHTYDEFVGSCRDIESTMQNEINNEFEPWGVRVSRFGVTNVNYAPEIASQMLAKQQAQAIIDARASIVDGAIKISERLDEDLANRLSSKQRAQLIRQVTLAMVSGEKPQATYSVDSDVGNKAMSSKSKSKRNSNPAGTSTEPMDDLLDD
jgi:regulator of protease activity HflC (stomatin/prohibitin superfamily)